MSRPPRGVAAAVAALCALGVGTLTVRRAGRAREALRGGTSFSASYAWPAGDEIVYTRLRYEDGAYVVVRRPRAGVETRVLAGDARTELRGVASGDAAVVWSLEGNAGILRVGRRGGGTTRIETAAGLLSGLHGDGRYALLLGRGHLEILQLSDGSVRPLPETARLLAGVRPSQSRFVQASLDPAGRRLVFVRPLGDRFVLRLATLPAGPVATLRESAGILMRPAFLPDGSGATFVARTPEGWEVRRVGFPDGRETLLERSQRFIESAELHPNGLQLLLTLGDDAEFRGYMSGLHVYEKDLSTGRLERIGE